MLDQILETIKTLAPLGSLVVSILAYKQSKKEKGQDDVLKPERSQNEKSL